MARGKPPALQWYVRDWLASPTRLLMSKPARSAYRDLLDYCWDCECKLPSDPESLRKLADCTPEEWEQFGSQVLENFTHHSDGFITNKKLYEAWRNRGAFIKRQQAAGKLSAKKRWGSGDCTRVTSVTNWLQPKSNSSSSSSSSSSTANTREETKSVPQPKKRASALPEEFPLTDAMKQSALKCGVLDPAGEFEAFKDFHAAKGNVFKDWFAAWRTWCRNSKKFGPKQSLYGFQPNQGVDENERRRIWAIRHPDKPYPQSR